MKEINDTELSTFYYELMVSEAGHYKNFIMLIKVEQGVLLLRIKLPFAIVVGLLFCTLATMELPELINLVDDTSNDFSLIVFVKNAATSEL